ncbi:flagellar assembly protein FliO [Thalassobius sp. MITS945101]|uniref:flagellar assembly protein FliO n=1 Tax=Thalassobius sp. MITS945101 TaxID=3096994 RepID=UPI00399AA357
MDLVDLNQLLTVGGFLAALLAVRFVVQANKGKLKTRINHDRRMSLGEVTALGPDARAMLLTIDDQEFLVVTAKRQAPVVTPLAPKAASAAAPTPIDAATLAGIAA